MIKSYLQLYQKPRCIFTPNDSIIVSSPNAAFLLIFEFKGFRLNSRGDITNLNYRSDWNFRWFDGLCYSGMIVEMEDTQEKDGKPPEEFPEDTHEKKRETLDEMLSRHRKEISQLQNKEAAMKKAAAKGSKAEQKAKKKQVEDEISQLSSDLKEKQAAELASIGYSSGSGKEKSNLDNLVKAIAGVSVTSQAEHSRPSKSAKRREKRAQQEAAREQRIQEEQSNIVKTEGDSDISLAERFENYCKEIESTAAWGGQLELGALTHCLKKHIMIFSGSFPDVEMGKEYKSDVGRTDTSNQSIMLSYHKHAFGLGEHYNSVIPGLVR
ncbi:unnamed protein product, partial [Vitis vinifera]